MISEPTFIFNKTIIIFSHKGEKISFKNDNLIVLDNDGNIKLQYSCYKIFLIFIVGGFTLTSGLIEKSRKFGFSLVFLNINFKVYATINYKTEGNTSLRIKQYNTDIAIKIGQKIIMNKIQNQCEMLSKIRDNTEFEGKDKLYECINKISMEKNLDINTIMGFEGIASKVYFNRIFDNMDWNGRKPRVKKDIPNLLLDIGYTILFNYIEALLNIYGFDTYKGNLHQEFYKRKSLVCDIIEPFRPIIDYKVRKMYNLNQISESLFSIKNGQYNLNWKDSNKIIISFLEEITEYRQCIFRYIQNYYRWFMKNEDIEKMPIVRLEKNDFN